MLIGCNYRAVPPLLLVTCLGFTSCSGSPQSTQAPPAPKPASDPRPFALELQSDGSVTQRGGDGTTLAGDALNQALIEWSRSAPDAFASGQLGDPAINSGPELTIDSSDDATHAALEALLRASVECGIRRFYLRGDSLAVGLPFTLQPEAAAEGLGGNTDSLPPLRLQLRCDESGELARIVLQEREIPDLPTLQSELIELLGPPHAAVSDQEAVVLELDCDPALRMKHVLLAMDYTSGYDDREGLRRVLVPTFRPVVWDQEIESVELESLRPATE